MNILILFTDGENNEQNEMIEKVFREAISRITSSHNLSIVPVVYPMLLSLTEDY